MTIEKIPLSDSKSFETETSIRIFKIDKETLKRNARKLWVNVEFDTDYSKDEMKPKEFHLMIQSPTVIGASILIDETMIENILNFIREEKKKVYCFHGSKNDQGVTY